MSEEKLNKQEFHNSESETAEKTQKKREKRMQELRNTLEIGDGVVTAGGIVGRVISIKEDTVVIESASSKIRVKRWSISEVEKLEA